MWDLVRIEVRRGYTCRGGAQPSQHPLGGIVGDPHWRTAERCGTAGHATLDVVTVGHGVRGCPSEALERKRGPAGVVICDRVPRVRVPRDHPRALGIIPERIRRKVWARSGQEVTGSRIVAERYDVPAARPHRAHATGLVIL